MKVKKLLRLIGLFIILCIIAVSIYVFIIPHNPKIVINYEEPQLQESTCLPCLSNKPLFKEIELSKYRYSLQYDMSPDNIDCDKETYINNRVQEVIDAILSERIKNIYETCKECSDLLAEIEEWKKSEEWKLLTSQIEKDVRVGEIDK